MRAPTAKHVKARGQTKLMNHPAEVSRGIMNAQPLDRQGRRISHRYACYAMALLVIANFLNYFDRYLMSVLAEYVKIDLKLDDTELGFLFGTAFALLFGVVGIPMGRIADHISRTKLMATGLAWWSAMTCFAGAATSFPHFAAARVGVGLGEAVANPCSHSLISEYFPARVRSTALGLYLAGAYVGIGAAFIGGGYMVGHWPSLCTAVPIAAACEIKPWQATFLLGAAPGLFFAALIAALREPGRPIDQPHAPRRANLGREFLAVLPPFTLFELARTGGAAAVARNLIVVALLALSVAVLGSASGDWYQWLAASLSVYALASWAQTIQLRDPAVFALTFGDRSFRLIMVSTALIAVVTTTILLWATPYAIRVIKLSAPDAGLYMGVVTVLTSVCGGIVGGAVADRWKRHDRRAPIWINLLSLLLPIPALFGMVSATSATAYLTAYGVFCLFAHINAAAVGALIQDLSLPRMRGTVSAINAMVILTFCATIGPYFTGKVSTSTGSLAAGMLALLVFVPPAIIVSIMAARSVANERIEEREQRASNARSPRRQRVDLAIPERG